MNFKYFNTKREVSAECHQPFPLRYGSGNEATNMVAQALAARDRNKSIIELWLFTPQFQIIVKTSFHADASEAGVYYLWCQVAFSICKKITLMSVL